MLIVVLILFGLFEMGSCSPERPGRIVCDPCPPCPPQNITKIVYHQEYPLFHVAYLGFLMITMFMYIYLMVIWWAKCGGDGAGYALGIFGFPLVLIAFIQVHNVLFPYIHEIN